MGSLSFSNQDYMPKLPLQSPLYLATLLDQRQSSQESRSVKKYISDFQSQNNRVPVPILASFCTHTVTQGLTIISVES